MGGFAFPYWEISWKRGSGGQPTLAELDPLTGKPVNPSSKVVALQRSRFGSNTFGAWITLREPIALSPNGQLFIHAWVRSPKAGRVLIAGWVSAKSARRK